MFWEFCGLCFIIQRIPLTWRVFCCPSFRVWLWSAWPGHLFREQQPVVLQTLSQPYLYPLTSCRKTFSTQSCPRPSTWFATARMVINGLHSFFSYMYMYIKPLTRMQFKTFLVNEIEAQIVSVAASLISLLLNIRSVIITCTHVSIMRRRQIEGLLWQHYSTLNIVKRFITTC